MAITQRETNSSGPLRPVLGQRLKPGGGGSSARRALSSLGSSNRRANLRLAESLLTISASDFCSKWNFNPLTETPMPQGQFLWTPVKPPTSKVLLELAKTRAECDLAACFKLPQKEIISRLNTENSTSIVSEGSVQTGEQIFKVSDVSVQPKGQICQVSVQPVKESSCCKLSKSENTKMLSEMCTYGENNNSLAPNTTFINHKQSAITDFMQASKRSESSYMLCESPSSKSKTSNTEDEMLPSPSDPS